MLKNLFFPKRRVTQKPGAKAPGSPKPGEKPEAPDEEFQIPSLHRKKYVMTADLMRRREEEALRRRYQLSTSKTGMYL